MFSITSLLVAQFCAICYLKIDSLAEPLLGNEHSEIRKTSEIHVTSVAVIVDKYSINNANAHLCTGTLVTRTQILTAASCLKKISNVNQLEVIFGTTNTIAPRHRKFDVLSKLTYEDWCKNRRNCFLEEHTDDICILKLKTPAVGIPAATISGLNGFAKDIATPVSGTRAKLLGWGHTKDEIRPKEPVKGNTYILSKGACEERVKKQISSCLSDVVLPEKVLCSAANPPVLGAQGDFGGPVSFDNDRSISAILIQRCPIYHPNDIRQDQVNLLLYLAFYRGFLSSTLEF
ncbi:hypothetical protein QAD02_011397 [Eretmocerus hayati]|uniref:Uncharacterized protein n=1 Tax=Eretmocerus hayati TaxID=131215 RepID=A0ACC2NYC8_9HYME|nr:hypothetical protein QAD02_011397 [Eretmocerus hayati]